jgi:hypothetical protein
MRESHISSLTNRRCATEHIPAKRSSCSRTRFLGLSDYFKTSPHLFRRGLIEPNPSRDTTVSRVQTRVRAMRRSVNRMNSSRSERMRRLNTMMSTTRHWTRSERTVLKIGRNAGSWKNSAIAMTTNREDGLKRSERPMSHGEFAAIGPIPWLERTSGQRCWPVPSALRVAVAAHGHLYASADTVRSKHATRENQMNTRQLLWVATVFALLGSGELFAQTSVDPRVQKLEETVRVLERRVAALEEQLRGRDSSPSVPADKVNWRKLRKGMSGVDVEQLLGSPTRVDAFGPFTVWHYGDRSRGSVQFNGHTQTVESWHEP